MAQTREGAIKIAAKKCGLTVDEYQSLIASGLKHCTCCKEWKPVDLFNRDATRYDGKASKCQDCIRVKERVSTKGRPSTFKGKSHSEEAKRKMSEAAKDRPSKRKGMKHTPETRARLSAIMKVRTPRGEAHYAYKHGKHQRDRDQRRTVEYAQWRMAVFTRDNFTCLHCGDNRGGNLQAHHIKGFAEHESSRFDIDNGLTLCQDCHERVHLKPIPMFKCRRKKHPHPDTSQ